MFRVLHFGFRSLREIGIRLLGCSGIRAIQEQATAPYVSIFTLGISKRRLTPLLLFSYIFLQACDGCGLQKKKVCGLRV